MSSGARARRVRLVDNGRRGRVEARTQRITLLSFVVSVPSRRRARRPVSWRAWIAAIALALWPGLARADVGLIVLEPIKTLGVLTRAGHAAIYLSRICPDGSPVRLRLCRADERGSVLSKYSSLGGDSDYDWAVVPIDRFLDGVASPGLDPLIATPALRAMLRAASFDPVFGAALARRSDGGAPDGAWTQALAARADRTLYIFSIATAVDDDAAVVATFNAMENRSHFNFFYDNCSDQAKAVFDLLLTGGTIGDRVAGLTMETPKGLAKALVDRALRNPALELSAIAFPQLPGTARRSGGVLFPMENMYRNLTFLPYWYFGGFRAVAIGAWVYHHTFARFSVRDAFQDFLSPHARDLTTEQRRLQRTLADMRNDAAISSGPEGAQARFDRERARETIAHRLSAIAAEKRDEIDRVLGTAAQWREFQRELVSTARGVENDPALPAALRAAFSHAGNGRLSKTLLRFFQAHGGFYMDEEARGPWMRLTLDGAPAATGLSERYVLAGDRRVAFLVLAAAIDYHLHAAAGRRESVAYMERTLALLRESRAAWGP